MVINLKKIVIILILGIIGLLVMFNLPEKDIKEDKNNNIKEEKKTDIGEDKTYTFENQTGEEVNIKAEKVVQATGFAGASNHVFYLEGSTLYYEDLAKESKTVLAENINDLYLDGDRVTAKLDKNGKIITENNYIVYEK